MITLAHGPEVEPVCWTPSGRVQVKRTVIYGAVYPALLGVFSSVPAMQLRHSDGRKALGAVLHDLPHHNDIGGTR